MMNRRKLGRSDLHVSELCLGTQNFGWHTNEAAAFEILDTFFHAGGNFIQTGGGDADDGPGVTTSDGSEAYVGRWLCARAIPRDELVLATRLTIAPTGGRPALFKTASALRRSCENSLRRLQVRYLDLLILEWQEELPMDEILSAADTLVRAGMVRHIAASGFPAWRVMEWVAHSARRNLCRVEAMQNDFSLLSNAGVNAESMSLARAHWLGFIARSPLAGGYLAARTSAADAPEDRREDVQREVQAVAHARHTTPSRVALAWALAHAGVSSVLVTVESVTQLVDRIGATALDLSLSEIQRLDARWKRMSGPVPDDEGERPEHGEEHTGVAVDGEARAGNLRA